MHAPGRVFTDLAVAITDGADAVSGIDVLRDREDLHGPVASMLTTWRVLDRIDADHLDPVRAARAAARARAWDRADRAVTSAWKRMSAFASLRLVCRQQRRRGNPDGPAPTMSTPVSVTFMSVGFSSAWSFVVPPRASFAVRDRCFHRSRVLVRTGGPAPRTGRSARP